MMIQSTMSIVNSIICTSTLCERDKYLQIFKDARQPPGQQP